MKNILKIQNCYNCSVCSFVCPTNCIDMEKQESGFLIPKVDTKKCIECGLCLKKCPSYSTGQKRIFDECYILKSKDKGVLDYTASGGVFATIALCLFEKGWSIFGCVFNDDMQAVIKEAHSLNDVKKMCGSKYVSSDATTSYIEVKRRLLEGKNVFFSGLPCQCGALKKYLGKEYDNLITFDLICHGTPSQKLFDKYILSIEKKYKCKVIECNFRTKRYTNWGEYVLEITLENNKHILIPANLDLYYQVFFSNKSFRHSCYNCQYALNQRESEVTIGDAWGMALSSDDYRGLSCLIVNNMKGNAFFNSISVLFDYKKVTFNQLKENNHQLYRPSFDSRNDNDFYENIDVYDFEQFCSHKGIKINKPIFNKVKYKVKLILKYLKLKG